MRILSLRKSGFPPAFFLQVGGRGASSGFFLRCKTHALPQRHPAPAGSHEIGYCALSLIFVTSSSLMMVMCEPTLAADHALSQQVLANVLVF